MVDDVKDITEKAESKEALDRARLARERREAEQRKRLDELRAHAAAAQAQREKRDEDRRRRMAEARSKDEDRRTQVEERKRAIWEASVSRREALLQRERDRTERLERARAARSSPRPAFAFGSSTPRLLEPVDSAGFFWAARRAASTTNVMFASAPLTRRASALQLDTSDTDNKDEPVSPQPLWSSVARRRTDLVPTLPARPGRAYSMTRLDRIHGTPPASTPHGHHSRSQTRSGDTTPSRPGSAMSNNAGVVRRASSAPRKPRPASIAGTGVNTPRGTDTGANSVATTPSVSRDATVVSRPSSARRPRPLSLHAPAKTVPSTPAAPGEGKPPLHRKPKPSKEHDKNRKSMSVSPGRGLSPSKETDSKDVMSKSVGGDKSVINALEVTQKLEALRIDSQQPSENKSVEIKHVTNIEQNIEHKEKIDVQKPEKIIEDKEEKKEKKEEREEKKEKKEEKKGHSQEKTEENEMTASMISRRITTEEEAKAALAERRRRAREELERQAELERQRLQREAEEEEERQRQEEERQRREEEEARELAALQRAEQEEKLRKAIEAQQQLEREEAERRQREQEELVVRLREEEERKKAAEEEERRRRGDAEREERERLARKQRVEAIMARTRLKKQAEEDKKQQEMKAQQNQPANGVSNNTSAQGNAMNTNETQEHVNTSVKQDNVNTSVTQENANTSVIQQNFNTSAIQDNVNVSVTQENVITNTSVKQENVTTSVTQHVSTNVTQASVTSVQETQEIIATADSAAIPNESARSGNIPNTDASEKSTADAKGSVNLVNVESELKVENAQSSENVASIDNSNGNVETGELLSLGASHSECPPSAPTNNGNMADLLGLSTQIDTTDKPEEQTPTKQIDNAPILDTNNGNSNVGHISANFIQTERMAEVTNKLADDFATHNGHGHNHPLTLQNAI